MRKENTAIFVEQIRKILREAEKSIKEQAAKVTEEIQSFNDDDSASTINTTEGDIEDDSSNSGNKSLNKEILDSGSVTSSSSVQQEAPTSDGTESQSAAHVGETIVSTTLGKSENGRERTASGNDAPTSAQVVGIDSAEGSRSIVSQDLHSEVNADVSLEAKNLSLQVSKQDTTAGKDRHADIPISKVCPSSDNNKSLGTKKPDRFSISKVSSAAQEKSATQARRTELEPHQQKGGPENISHPERATVKTELHKDGQKSPEIHATVSCEKDQIKLVKAESMNSHSSHSNASSATLSNDSVEEEVSKESLSSQASSSSLASGSASTVDSSGGEAAVKGRFKVKATTPGNSNDAVVAGDGKIPTNGDSKRAVTGSNQTVADVNQYTSLKNDNKVAVAIDSGVSIESESKATAVATSMTHDDRTAAANASKATAVDSQRAVVIIDDRTALANDSKTATVVSQGTAVPHVDKTAPASDTKSAIASDCRPSAVAGHRTSIAPVSNVDQKAICEGSKKISDGYSPLLKVNSRESLQGVRVQPQVVSDGESGKQSIPGTGILEDKPPVKAANQQQLVLVPEKSEMALRKKASTSHKSQGNERSQTGAKTQPIFRLGSSSEDADEVVPFSKTSTESPRKCLSPTVEYTRHGVIDLVDPTRHVQPIEPTYFPYGSDAYNDRSVPPDLISDTSSVTSGGGLDSPAITPSLTPSSSLENLLNIDAQRVTRQVGSQIGEKAHFERSLSLNSVSSGPFVII